MAAIEYGWQDISEKKVLDCIRWCQNKLNLRDWHIDVYFGPESPPLWEEDSYDPNGMAHSAAQHRRLAATFWLRKARIKERGCNLYQSAIHEVLHIFFNSCGTYLIEGMMDAIEENAIHRLESVLFECYCYEKGLEIPEPVDYIVTVRD